MVSIKSIGSYLLLWFPLKSTWALHAIRQWVLSVACAEDADAEGLVLRILRDYCSELMVQHCREIAFFLFLFLLLSWWIGVVSRWVQERYSLRTLTYWYLNLGLGLWHGFLLLHFPPNALLKTNWWTSKEQAINLIGSRCSDELFQVLIGTKFAIRSSCFTNVFISYIYFSCETFVSFPSLLHFHHFPSHPPRHW